MDHKIAHPGLNVPGCFGCKVYGIGYDGKHLTKKTLVRNDDTGIPAGYQTEHRSGREDAVARPDTIIYKRT